MHAQSYPTLCNPMDCNPPGSSVMEFSRQEYWSGLPFSPPGDLLDPEIKPESPGLQADSLPTEPPGKPSQQTKDALNQGFPRNMDHLGILLQGRS